MSLSPVMEVLHPGEVDFRRLLSRTEVLLSARDERDPLQHYRDVRLRKYLRALLDGLEVLKDWAAEEGEARLTGDGKDPDVLLPSPADLREYSRKIQLITGLLDTATKPIRFSRTSNVRVENPEELIAKAKVEASQKDKFRRGLLKQRKSTQNNFPSEKQSSPTTRLHRSEESEGKAKPLTGSQLKDILKHQELERGKMTDEMVEFTQELKRVHLRTHSQLVSDNKDLETLMEVVDKNSSTVGERKKDVDDLIDSSSGLTWLYWGIILFASITFIMMFLFIKVTSYIPL